MSKEIESLQAYCYKCWAYLGVIAGLPTTLVKIQPLCPDCFKKNIGDTQPPKGWKPHE